MMIEMAVALVSIIFLGIWRWNRRRSCSILTNWPVIGMIPGFIRGISISGVHDFATHLVEQSGGTFLFKGPWFSGMNFLMTSDPTNVQYIASKNFGNYPKGPEYSQLFEPLGDGIFTVDSDCWKMQRRIIHSLLKNKRFHLALETTLEHKLFKGLFLVLENASELQAEVDMQDIFQRFTFDTVCMLVLSFDPNCLSIDSPHIPFAKAFDEMEEAILYRHLVPSSIWKLQRWLHIGKEKKLRDAWDTLDLFLEQCITRKTEQLSQRENQIESDQDFDLLTYFFMKDEYDYVLEGENIKILTKSNKFLRDTATNLLAAGRDTISASLVWFFWAIGKHPFVEKRILEEIKTILQPDNHKWRVFSLEDLNKLVYLHAVISETLRLYPSVPILHKVSIEQDILPSGHHVPRNMRILYFLYSMGRREQIWGKDCLQFKPERWISEDGKIKHVSSFKFIAFNAGPRTCLGKDLTFSQLKIITSAVVWNYSLQLVENHQVGPSNSVILHMKNGFKVRVSKRFTSR